MRTIAARFESDVEAASAMSAVKNAGISADDIDFVHHTISSNDTVLDGVGAGAQLGLLAGGLAAMLVGLGSIAVPGIDPASVSDWVTATAVGTIVGTVLGAAIGGLIGALASVGSLLTVRAPDERAEKVSAILFEAGAVRAAA